MQDKSTTPSLPAATPPEDALARVGTDVTSGMNAAIVARMKVLLLAKYPSRSDFQRHIAAAATETAPAASKVLMLGLAAGLIVASRTGTPAADVKALVDFASHPRGSIAETPAIAAAARRTRRAARLFQHLVMIGCLRRGEVPGVQAGNGTYYRV